MVILIIGFQILSLFCVACSNLRKEKLHSLGSSDLVFHSSIDQCMVNGSIAMAAHS